MSSRDCRHFAAGELKVVQRGPLRSATENLGNIDDTSISGGRYQLFASLCSPLIYTDAYTFGFENWLISVAFPNVRGQAGFGSLIPAENKRSLVRLKKWFVYQSTGKQDELKTACLQWVMKEGKEADDILFSL